MPSSTRWCWARTGTTSACWCSRQTRDALPALTAALKKATRDARESSCRIAAIRVAGPPAPEERTDKGSLAAAVIRAGRREEIEALFGRGEMVAAC